MIPAMSRICKNILKILGAVVLTAATAVFAAMAFPNDFNANGWGFIACFSLIPLFCIVNHSSYKTVWLYGLVYGFVFYLFYNSWLSTFHPLAILIAPVIESVQYMLLFPALKAARSLLRKRGYLMQAVVYVCYLYITQLGFLGYPYGNISAALWNMPLLIQSASVFGIWGICLLLAVPQAFIASFAGRWRAYRVDITVYALVFLANIVLGWVTLSYFEKTPAQRTVRIAAVQHSADSWEGGYPTYRRNFETLTALTEEALLEEPDLVVWSETAFVPSVAWHTAYPSSMVASNLVKRFVEFGLSMPVPLVTGNAEGLIKDETLPAFLEDGSWNWKTYNTVILFGEGEIQGTYRKQHLVPFTEHFPYEEQLPWLYELLLANDYKWWEPGLEQTVFSFDGIEFSTPICFEDTFGYLSAQFVGNGADVLLNLTNDSWSGSVAAQMQHMQLAVFRAVENRRPLLRSTNSGMTCLVLPTGEVVGMLEPFTQAWGIYDVPLGQYGKMTFYTKFPDLLPKLLLVLVAISIPVAIFHAKKRRSQRRYDHLFEGYDSWLEC